MVEVVDREFGLPHLVRKASIIGVDAREGLGSVRNRLERGSRKTCRWACMRERCPRYAGH